MNNCYLSFAPLQGYTDAVYRRAHHHCVGGIDEYYTPFVRIEKGSVRRRDLRDCDPLANEGVPTVPQVIARDRDEFAQLCDALGLQGWRRIDLNMGCPFPMQTRAGRGCGLLQHPDKVEEIAQEMIRRKDMVFSVKMRLGQESIDEGINIMPIINDMPLLHVVLHPRLGRLQYKGSPDLDTFGRFMQLCRHPMVYNGDVTGRDQMDGLLTRYPGLKGLMLGRGLLAQPWLSACDAADCAPSIVLRSMHSEVYRHATAALCGDSQILSRLHAFWEYADIDRKHKKAILKSSTLSRYDEAVATF